MTQISFRAEIDDYTNRVLGVVKEKYGLENKSQALNKFASMYGSEFIEPEIKEELLSETSAIVKKHFSKNAKRRMSVQELDKLTQ